MAWKGSSHVANGTGRLPCLTWVKRSSSAAARTRPSFTRQAAGSWKAALIPSVYMPVLRGSGGGTGQGQRHGAGGGGARLGQERAGGLDDLIGGDQAQAVVVNLGADAL